MSHEDWLRHRQRGIGGSDAAAILGLLPWKTALEVYYDKTAEEPVQIEENPRMRAGKKLENVIAEYFTEETGLELRRDNKIRIHQDYPFMLGDLDRIILPKNGEGPGVFEAKSTSGFAAAAWELEIPLYFFAQVQHYFFVTGYQWGEIGILVDGWDFRHSPLEPALDYQKLMLERCEQFWNDHVLKRIPPPPMNEADLKLLYDRSVVGKKVVATPGTIELHNQAVPLKQSKGAIEKDYKALTEQIKIFMLDAEILVGPDDDVLATYKTGKDRLRFDEDRFRVEHPELYAQYSNMVPGNRTLLIK